MTVKVWVNVERTVLVRRWHDRGENEEVVEVAVRDSPDHTWGPPIRCRPERT